MKRIIAAVVLFFIVLVYKPVSALELSAKSAVLYEPVTERIIYHSNKDERLPMASTTKILSAITAIENGNLSDVVTVSKNAANIEGSSIWLEEGEKLTLQQLIYGMLLSSGNDAAVAIAEHISGNNIDVFSAMMNNVAKKAGAKNSNFTNPSGLDNENHYTTALDLAKITAYALKNPIFKEIVSTKTYNIPWDGHEWGRSLKNHNKLLNMYEGCNGVKTGFTKKSGRCLVSSAERNGVSLIAVTLKAPDDWNDHMKMLDYGFSNLRSEIVVEKGSGSGEIKINNGLKDEISYGVSESFSLPATEKDVITTKNVLAQFVEAPVMKGETIGYAEISLNGDLIKKIDLIAEEDCEKIYIPKLLDFVSMIIKSII